MPPAPISSTSVYRSPKRWPGATRNDPTPLGIGDRTPAAVEAERTFSAKVRALQEGQCPSGGTSPPQCGQLTGARSLVAPRTSGPSGEETEGAYVSDPIASIR